MQMPAGCKTKEQQAMVSQTQLMGKIEAKLQQQINDGEHMDGCREKEEERFVLEEHG